MCAAMAGSWFHSLVKAKEIIIHCKCAEVFVVLPEELTWGAPATASPPVPGPAWETPALASPAEVSQGLFLGCESFLSSPSTSQGRVGNDLFLHLSLTLSFDTEFFFFFATIKVVQFYVFVAELVEREVWSGFFCYSWWQRASFFCLYSCLVKVILLDFQCSRTKV